jgi:hypothetical protein
MMSSFRTSSFGNIFGGIHPIVVPFRGFGTRWSREKMMPLVGEEMAKPSYHFPSFSLMPFKIEL